MIKRYTRPAMGRLFTDKHKFDTWLAVEIAVCEAWAEQGGIPKDALKRIKSKAKFKLRSIEEIEAKVHHDVIAFNTAVAEYIGEDSAFWHKGLTSSDVVDTAQSLVLKEAGQKLEEGLGKLRQAIGQQAVKHKHTPVMGRTHGVHAEPTTFGLKMLIWYDELGRHEERLAAAIDYISVGKLSGAVGNFAHIPPSFEERVLSKLGLQAAPVSNQIVQRDRHAFYVSVLAGIGATMEKIAINLRTYQRTEIYETQEPFAKGQKGSSAMPHKKNPILLERVTGLARLLRGFAVTALENVALWDERDISHSGAERVILPDACVTLDYMFAKLTGVIEGLEVNASTMERNIYFTKGLIFSQRVLLELTNAGLSREDAYALVQRNAMRCWEQGTPLLDALLDDAEVRAVLKPQAISSLFNLEPYLAHVDELFVRVGLADEQPVGSKSPRRRRSRRGMAERSEQGNVESLATVSGAVQNIAERPEDYYESRYAVEEKKKVGREGDETLGEAEHQRKSVRGSRSRGKRGGVTRTRSSASKRDDKPVTAKTEPKAEAKEQVKDEPKADEARTEQEEKKPRRRRGTRGGRKRRATKDKPATPSHEGDDSYVD